MNWDRYPNFGPHEFVCKETGEHGMTPEFMERLQALRSDWGRPMRITSGYRSPRHSIEARKISPGTHTDGIACDVAIGAGEEAYDFIALAIAHGFTGIGVSQKNGSPRFIHLDIAPRKAIWSY